VNASGSTDPALVVDRLEFSYGQLQVLFGISLELRRGEALALLGTNGAGKSTLLRVISGLERPSRGSVTYFGEEITGVAPEELPKRGLLMVVGGKSVFSDMTVAENLEMACVSVGLSSKEKRTRFDDVYAIFPAVRSRRAQKAGSLSGGEQQQIALSRALLLRPRVLCVDELSLGLAPVLVGQLIDIVVQLRDAGVSLIVVEQSLSIAAQICERAVFLEKGQVRFEGSTRELLARDDIARAVFLGGATSATAPSSA
jgi:ABC-type branched-subunit amino acid transport system ATPase component